MKNTVIFLAIFCLPTVPLYAQNNGAMFKFDEETHDFGTVKRGAPAIDTFWFTNAGTRPLNIQDVTPSCGCTNVKWSSYPVKPGAKGYISLSLNTAEQHGIFNKEVYIRSDAVNNPYGDKRYTIHIKGDAKD